ncbi:Centromere/kinetochore protein zw10 [Boothiomyces macroporosus]|uniref:Centromere/kinetochore protein zw10 n=1 Tax=Boothiomyces macroporosus TaxID=261099 RepID=A0AAD5UP35_9FUNG|nr:Centromere/kinetochore protein zw10 [Boothiomyces macroporosus]
MQKEEIEILTSNVTLDFLKYELRNFRDLDINTAIKDIENVWKHYQDMEMIEAELNKFEAGEIQRRIKEMKGNISRIEQQIRIEELVEAIENNQAQFIAVDLLADACNTHDRVKTAVEALYLQDIPAEQFARISEKFDSLSSTRKSALAELRVLFQKFLVFNGGDNEIVIPRQLESSFFKSWISFETLLTAVLEFDVNQDHFDSICKDIKDLIARITKTDSVLLFQEEDRLKLTLEKDIVELSSPKKGNISSLNAIASIINFMNKKLNNFPSFKLTLYNKVWNTTCQSIIDNYLQIFVPSDVDQVYDYQQQYTLVVEDFLQRISNDLYTGELLFDYLSGCLESVLNEQTKHFTETAKELIFSQYQEVKVLEKKRDSLPTGKAGIFNFPSCSVHSNVFELTSLIDLIVSQMESCSDQMLLKLASIVKNILDRSRAQFYNILSLEQSSEMLMLYHNDCMYLGHKCQTWLLSKSSKLPSELSIVDLTVKFRSLAQRFFGSAIDSQKVIIGRIVEKAEGLDCEDESRFRKVKTTISQVSQHFVDLHTVWKEIIPRHVCLIGLGYLVDHLSELLTNEILLLYDITEVESNRLSEILAIEAIQSIFREDAPYSLINHYTGPKYAHYLTLIQLLAWSMSNIMECWRLGALNEFKVKDLVHLIKALFSDSELRAKNIKEIEKSGNI